MALLKKYTRTYDLFIVCLALFSIILVVLDFSSAISLTQSPFYQIDWMIIGIFALDYIVRFIIAPDKKAFFKENIFDLLAILPFNTIFSFFRLSRIFRIARITKIFRLTRLIGISGKLRRSSNEFLHTNGFIYLLYISCFILIISSIGYSIAENVSLIDAFWWAMTTVTTVGYGDMSPTTSLGKIAAILLMLLGIRFIGMLTSSITGFFTAQRKKEHDEIARLHQKVDLLIHKIEQLEEKDT